MAGKRHLAELLRVPTAQGRNGAPKSTRACPDPAVFPREGIGVPPEPAGQKFGFKDDFASRSGEWPEQRCVLILDQQIVPCEAGCMEIDATAQQLASLQIAGIAGRGNRDLLSGLHRPAIGQQTGPVGATMD